MKNSFNDLGISPQILKALEEMGYETPTEVQSKAIPRALNHEDLIVMSKTGSGKTAVFGVSMLQLIDPKAKGPQGLILTPTRELAVQINSEIKKISKHTGHKTTAVYGQHSMNTELQELNRGVSIVTGTPGRVFDHIQSKNLETQNIRFLVLDEADRMLDMGFFDQVVKIVRNLPRQRTTLLFSATIPPQIRRICKEYMNKPSSIDIKSETKTVDSIEQMYYRVNNHQKNNKLHNLLLMERPESCMIFCNTRVAVDRVQNFLFRKGYRCYALHGNIPQSKRMKTIQQFKSGQFNLLIATDVAARGIHIDNLSLVINYDIPLEKDSYVHRIGRTGRAGNGGRAVNLVTSEDIMTLYGIEEHIGAMIPERELPSEEIYKEQKTEVDKWVKENSLHSMPPMSNSGHSLKRPYKNHSGSNSNRAQKPYSHSNSNRPQKSYSGSNSNRPQKNYSGSNSNKTQKPYSHSNSNRPPKKPYSRKPNQHYNKQYDNQNDRNHINHNSAAKTGSTYSNNRPQKPVNTETKATQKTINNTAINSSKQNIDNNTIKNTKTKQSFIKRVFDKILGK